MMLYINCRSGRMNFSTALAFTKYLVNETHYLPWATAIGKLAPIVDRLEDVEKFGYFQVSNSISVSNIKIKILLTSYGL